MMRPPPCLSISRAAACGEKRAGEIDAQKPFPILEGGIQRQLMKRDARVIDGDVDAAEPPHSFGDLRFTVARIGDVCAKGVSGAAGLSNCRARRRCPFTVSIRTKEGRSFLRE